MTRKYLCPLQTRWGAIDLLDIRLEDIDVSDIAYSLAHQNRYTGHASPPVNVAAHSIACSIVAPPEYAFEALMHDAHEAYLGDINGQVKSALRSIDDFEWTCLDELEERLRLAVAQKFGLPRQVSETVEEIDLRMLQTERLRAMHRSADHLWPSLESAPPYYRILGILESSAADAQQEFTYRVFLLAAGHPNQFDVD